MLLAGYRTVGKGWIEGVASMNNFRNNFRNQCTDSDSSDSRIFYQKRVSLWFPDSTPLIHKEFKDDPAGQRSGIDAIFCLGDTTFNLQIKQRKTSYGDGIAKVIALEDYHEYADGRPNKPGWARESMDIDFLLYIQKADRWDMCFDWKKLKPLIDVNIDTLWAEYPLKAAHNYSRGIRVYDTMNRLVPVGEFVGAAIGTVMKGWKP